MSEERVAQIERKAFDYFVKQANPRNGLVADTTRPGSPASIAVAGLALTVYAVGVSEGLARRAASRDRGGCR